MSEKKIARNEKSRTTVVLDGDIVQGGNPVKAGKPVTLYPDQIETLKAQKINAKPAPAQEG